MLPQRTDRRSARKRASFADQHQLRGQPTARKLCVRFVRKLKSSDIASPAVLLIRCSGSTEHQKRASRARQEARIEQLREMGYAVVESFVELRSARKLSRPKLVAAMKCAEREGAILVVESLSRLCRHPTRDDYHPSPSQLAAIKAIAPTVRIRSLYDPRLPFDKVHQLISEECQAMSPRKNGRPKKEESEDTRSGPQLLRNRKGMSRLFWSVILGARGNRLIELVGRKRSTVYRWLDESFPEYRCRRKK